MTVKFKNVIVGTMFLVMATGIICCEASDNNSQKQAVSIKSIVLESAENLYQSEKQIIRDIDNVRYSDMETELSPLLNDLMSDVVYLLEWVLEIDPSDIKANFLLGKIYYGKSDVGEGFRDKKMVELAKNCLLKVIKNNNSELAISKSDMAEARKIYNELINLNENTFFDE